MADERVQDPKPEPVVTGGPVADPEPVAPKLVAVKHGGRELQLPEDVASAWQEREREFEQRISRQGSELGELRKRVTQPVETRREEPKEPDIDTLWFENPRAAYQKIKTEIRQEVANEYRQDQAMKSFWDGFYRANDDLREDEWVVRGVMNEHLSELAELPVREAQKKLGDLTRSEILRIARKTKTNDHDRPRPDLLEPASGDRPARPAREDDDDPKSISGLLSQRRQQRMTARTKGA